MRPTPRLLFVAASLFLAATLRGHEAANEMVAAANKFLGSLDAAQKKAATFALTDAERENWNFVPIARQGATMKTMNDAQRDLAFALLKTGLSQANVKRTQAIMSLENILREQEKGKEKSPNRDPINYFVTIFGTPSAGQSWGWRFEGHHLAFNFTIIDGKHVFFTPGFMGTNPAEVRDGPRKGERVLADEEDQGLALINSLDESQRKTAIFAEKALTEIVTKNDKRVKPLSPEGIAASQLKPAQRAKLVALVKTYLARWRPELAEEEFKKVEAAGLDKLTFAWAGGLNRSTQTYYRIQGPTILIEFDNSQGNGNHIHSTVRDFKGDFGADLLAEHYAKEHGKK